MLKYPFLKVMLFSTLGIAFASAAWFFIVRANAGEGKKGVEKMPPFEIILLDNSLFSRKNIRMGEPTVFIYFNSTCDHCQNEIADILKNAAKFQDIQIVLVSEEGIDILNEFADSAGLNNQPGIIIASDKSESWKNAFHAKSTPTNFVYDKNRILIDILPKEMNAAGLLKLLLIHN